MTIKYVNTVNGKFKTYLQSEKENDKRSRLATLIWGDPVHVLDESGELVKVRARGRKGYVDPTALCDQGLLEMYIIDVGQGDAVLLKTPDDNWHLIDAGVPREEQMTKTGAADFLRWKFMTDLRREKVSLANVIVTHPDFDHYGGLLDVLAGQFSARGTYQLEVENFYHNGLALFKGSPTLGGTMKGQVDPLPNPHHYIRRTAKFVTELLDGKDSFESPPRPLGTAFAKLAALVSQVPRNVRRLCHRDEYLPGYRPGESDVEIRVLGPILEDFGEDAGLRWLSEEAWTRNGHSIVLRLDYGRARILLTGDLNRVSQRLLLSYHPQDEFAVDVAKACHHGAEDVYLDFVKAMGARATIISSGDNEGYAHPRPVLMGASARYGRECLAPDGELMAPLLYSTELARSVKLDHASWARVDLDKDPSTPSTRVSPRYVMVEKSGWKPKFRYLRYMLLAIKLVYGLVNVRTDGEHILCATMEEQGNDFDVKVFKAGVEPPTS